MRHPTEGTLRRIVDEPAGVADADRRHVADCPVCLSGLATAVEDASWTGVALDVDPAVDVDAGWARLTEGLTDGPRLRQQPVAGSPRWRTALRSPVLAALGVAALVAGASAAAAADWLQIFSSERIAPVTVSEADLVQMPDLSAYGHLQLSDEPDVRRVADADAAARATGLSVPQVSDLPRGVTGEPVFQVGNEVSAVFTFSAEEAARSAAAAGESLPPPPPGLDGSQFRLVAGPGLAAVWSDGRGLPAMVVARGIAPTAYSTGVPFETVRDYLLSLPGLPEDLASQLRSFSGEGTTLPLPVPADHATTASADVGGVSATVITARDGTMAGVVWVEDGVVTAVAGSLSADEVLSVARGLR